MPFTVEFPRERWEQDLEAFSQRNAGRPVRLEVEIPPGEGEPVLAEHRPLLGIGFDSKGSEAPAVEITVGALGGASPPNFTHVINNPTRIWVDQDPDGLAVAMEVASRDQGVTRVLFEREAALPREGQATGPV